MRKVPEHKKKELDVSKFYCVRLKEIRPEIKNKIQYFKSERNPGLGRYLHNYAWREELNNYRAYYVIMDGEEIVLYFSLQMGAMIKCHKKEIGGVLYHQEMNVYKIENDKIEIDKIVPAIEIPHFCVNDGYKKRRKKWTVTYKGVDYTVGQYAFYKYIVPLVIGAAENVGFQYLTLFCADDENNTLEKHYKTMGFERMDDMACLRDSYSKDLECLTIKIGNLVERYLRFEDPKYEIKNEKYLYFGNWRLEKNKPDLNE